MGRLQPEGGRRKVDARQQPRGGGRRRGETVSRRRSRPPGLLVALSPGAPGEGRPAEPRGLLRAEPRDPALRREPQDLHPRLAVRGARRPADAAPHGDVSHQARRAAQDLQATRRSRAAHGLRARLLRHAARPQLLHPVGAHRRRTGPHPVRLRRLLPPRPLRPPRDRRRGEAGPQPGADGCRDRRQQLPAEGASSAAARRRAEGRGAPGPDAVRLGVGQGSRVAPGVRPARPLRPSHKLSASCGSVGDAEGDGEAGTRAAAR